MIPEPLETPATGVRRSGRISREIPVLLSGGDAGGREFSEQTRTLVLSRHGASVLSRHKLIPEQEAFLRVVATNREIEVRICGQIGERGDGYIYGVAFLDQEIDFWGIEFPPAENLTKELTAVTLGCSGCHRQIAAQFDATEMDVYTVNQGSLRYCSRCAASTIWRLSTPRPEPPPALATAAVPAPEASLLKSMAAEVLPVAETSATTPLPQPNRRRDRRMKARCHACVRVSGNSEEIVPCEDMSRGGFSFRSARCYPEEALVEVAVPYEPGTSIFVSAQIANMRELQKGKLYRYGVAYLRSSRK